MARRTQVSKERILETAFQMLIRDGYDSINIKTLAAEIGCSTQPIVWHFENMAGFRRAFYGFCLDFANRQFAPWNGSLDDLFREMARGYISIAWNMPHLFRFVFTDSGETYRQSPVAQRMEQESYGKICRLLCREKGLTEAGAEGFVTNYEFYIHGMASYVAGGLCRMTPEQLLDRADRARDVFLKSELEREVRQ